MDTQSTKETQNDKDQIPNFNDLDRGWAWVIMAATFGTFLLIGGTVYGVGIIHIALLERYKQDITMTSWVGALHSAMMDIGGYKKIGYNIDDLRQTACSVVNPVKVNNFAYLFNCTAVGRDSD